MNSEPSKFLNLKRFKFGLIGVATLLLTASLTLASGESSSWTQWRGPNNDGSIDGSDWLKRWPRVRLKKKWSRNIGNGYSASSISDGRLVCAGYIDGKDYVYCFDAKTGKPKWAYSYPSEKFDSMNAGGPSSTPCIYKGLVFVMSREAKVFALDLKSGKVKWQVELGKKFGVSPPQWGFSGSPVVIDGKLYIDTGVIGCFEPSSGKLLWRTRNYGAGYSTPVKFTWKKKEYLVAFPALGLVVLDKKSGKEVSTFKWKTDYDVNAATPVIHENNIFISSGYNTGCALVKFEEGKLTQVWRNRNMRNHMATCIYHKGFLYGFDESLLRCLDFKTGKSVWKQRGYGKGSLLLARSGKADVLVVLNDRGGLVFAEASSKKFTPKVEKAVLSGDRCWSAPVIQDKHLYVRNPKGELACFELK